MQRPAWPMIAASVWSCLLATAVAAADAPGTSAAGTAAFFESKIRPVLVARCYECHGPKSEAEGKLRVDSRAALVAGGERGPAIAPGKPAESLLISAINHGEIVQMPPKSKLPAQEIADLTAWVAAGAVWPGSEGPAAPDQAPRKNPAEITAADRAFWAFKAPVAPRPPKLKNRKWPTSDFDALVLAPLEAQGLKPAPPANKATLIRRATFNLHGLPPSPEEVAAFASDAAPDAFAKVVDRLLASPRYGERWGRHWLDLARYSDSNGMDENMAMAHAWRYRDYVIRAFNRDLPYDQFVVEQLAGDLLPPADDATNFERLVATGFLVLGPKMLAEDDPVKMEMDIIDEQVDTIGRALLGLTLGCARCHDHKFDPIPTADYYSLAGIFKSTKTMENHRVVAMWSERPLANRQEIARLTAHEKQIAAAKQEISLLTKAANAKLLDEARQRTADYLLAATEGARQERELSALSAQLATAPPAAGSLVVEAEAFARGNVVRDTATYGQGIGVIYNAGPLPNFAEYDVDLPAAGTYQVALRYAAAESRPLDVTIDGRPVASGACARTTGSWQPDTQAWTVVTNLPLAAGRHLVRIERDGPLPHVDKWALAPARFVRDPATGVSRVLGQTATHVEGLQTSILRQWQAYLERTADDAGSVLRVWHAWVRAEEQSAIPKFDEADKLTAASLAAPRPLTLAELAARYGRLCLEAHNESRQNIGSQAQPERALAEPNQEALRQLLVAGDGPFAVPAKIEADYPAETKTSLEALKDRLAKLEKSKPALDQALAVSDQKPQNLKIHLRGSHLTLGDDAPRRFPRVLAGDKQPSIGTNSSGRLELARWIASPDNPLTARVMVNRIWQGHFGEGLVRSPDNFGRLGERPDNQPLLDWLARWFVDSGWSVKSMHRLIMLSSAFQMSTKHNAEAATQDPDNRLLWRMNRRRLEAEEIRDGILAASGEIDLAMGGTLLPNANHTYVTSTASTNNVRYENARRSVYLPVVRSALYEVFQAFDFADPSTMNGRRPSTTVAPQALFMMNSPLILRHSRAMAESLLGRPQTDDVRVSEAFQRVYGRAPAGAETDRSLEFLTRYQANLAPQKLSTADARLRAWQALCRVLLSANEFVYLE